jgi:AcrR family transcriptional regulator
MPTASHPADLSSSPARVEAAVTEPDGVHRKDTYHHGDLRAACVAAGLRLVAEGGADAVTIRGVARLAGVSHTAPLHHFRDRDELVAAVAQVGFDRLVDDANAAIDDPALDPLERLTRYGEAYIRRAVETPGLYRLMFDAAACEVGYEAYEMLIRLVAVSGLGGADPDPTALLLWAHVHGLAGLYADGKLVHELDGLPPGEIPQRAAAALRQLIDALVAAGGGHSPHDSPQKESPR